MSTTIDVRPLAPHDRQPLIFSTFDGLAAGDAIERVNDHGPEPLLNRFQAERHGRFSWHSVEQGPDTWRVRIGKTGRDCCGHCS